MDSAASGAITPCPVFGSDWRAAPWQAVWAKAERARLTGIVAPRARRTAGAMARSRRRKGTTSEASKSTRGLDFVPPDPSASPRGRLDAKASSYPRALRRSPRRRWLPSFAQTAWHARAWWPAVHPPVGASPRAAHAVPASREAPPGGPDEEARRPPLEGTRGGPHGGGLAAGHAAQCMVWEAKDAVPSRASDSCPASPPIGATAVPRGHGRTPHWHTGRSP